jgi:transcriptional regulator with XRE-family HTH domain
VFVPFNQRLYRTRSDKKITAADIRKLTGIAPGILSQYEMNRQMPGFKSLVALAEAIDVSLDYLCGFSDVREPLPRMLDLQPVAFASRLDQLLAARNLTAHGLGNLIKMQSQHINKWRKSYSHPSYWTLLEIAKQTKTSVNWLCGYETTMELS